MVKLNFAGLKGDNQNREKKKMVKIGQGALVVATAMFAGGCASIVSGHNQTVSVETRHQGQPVAGAACKLNNSKGTWFVTTPGSTTIHRAYGDLAVDCTHEKHEPASTLVKSSTKPMAFGNIIFGGAIGVGVDVATGAAYDYPTLISLELGMPLIAPAAIAPAAAPVAPLTPVADKK